MIPTRMLLRSLLPLLIAASLHAQVSSGTPDFLGTWEVMGTGTCSARTFEFLPDGIVHETSSYSYGGKDGQKSVERWTKRWSALPDKVVITKADGTSEHQKIEVSLPVSNNQIEIRETWVTRDSERTNTLKARRVAGSSAAPSIPSAPGLSSSNPDYNPQKLLLTVSPSVKTSTADYVTTQKVTLNLTIVNSDLKNSPGPLTVDYWIMGKNTKQGNQFCLFKSGLLPCTVGCGFASREAKLTTDPVGVRFYTNMISSGFYPEYAGWIISVTDSAGRLLVAKSNKPEWERQIAKTKSLDRGQAYGPRLEQLTDAPSVYYMGE